MGAANTQGQMQGSNFPSLRCFVLRVSHSVFLFSSSHVSAESSSPSQIRFQSDELTWFHLRALPGPAALAKLWKLLLSRYIHLSALRVLFSTKPQNAELALVWCWSTLGQKKMRANWNEILPDEAEEDALSLEHFNQSCLTVVEHLFGLTVSVETNWLY